MSESSKSSGGISKAILKGHKAPVLSLAHSNESRKKKRGHPNNANKTIPCCLLSGSSDGTARLWDLRLSSRAALCITTPQSFSEVTAVSFHPNSGCGKENIKGQNKLYPFTVYIAVGSSVYGYDLRNTTTPIIRQHDIHLSNLDGGEEINQITISKNTNKTYLAVADDDGKIRITDSLKQQPNKNVDGNRNKYFLHHDSNVESSTLVTSAAFRTRGLDIASGGTDCKVCLWDITRPRRPSSSFHIPADSSDVIENNKRAQLNQVWNPPVVHSLSWSPSGRLLAAGLGDGSSILFKLERRQLLEAGRLKGGHDAAVASILFPQFGSLSHLSSHATAEDRLLITAGNDGAIILWDLGTQIVQGRGAVDPANMFVSHNNDKGRSGGDKNIGYDGIVEGVEKLLLSTKMNYKILFGITHGLKPNCVVNSVASEPCLPSSLFVADTSNNITIYSLPCR